MTDPAERQHVLANLEQIRGESGGRIGRLWHADRPAQHAEQREEFRERIEADPRNYIAQPTIMLSRAPCFLRRPRGAAACRSAPLYSVRRQGDHRARRIDARGAAQRIAGGEFVAGRRQQGYLGVAVMLIFRVADSMYWMSRYLERAEHTARVLGVQLNLMLEQDPRSSDRRWLRVLGSLGHPGSVTENSDPFTRAQTYALRNITGGIASARENARQVREQISSEMWEQLNRLFHEVRRMESAGLWQAQPLDFLARSFSKARTWCRASPIPP
jgi:hypothetical protein